MSYVLYGDVGGCFDAVEGVLDEDFACGVRVDIELGIRLEPNRLKLAASSGEVIGAIRWQGLKAPFLERMSIDIRNVVLDFRVMCIRTASVLT
jgi:hypothetical protein